MSSGVSHLVKSLRWCNLGRCSYEKALKIQEGLVARHFQPSGSSSQSSDGVSNAEVNVLLLVEHDPVYTVGVRSNEFTQVDQDFLRQQGATFFRTNRGGLITFHGPGQLVAYPVINLSHFKEGVRSYVCHLEETLIKTCAEFGVTSGRTEHTGIWVNRDKIAAIGIHCKKYVVSHGVALNCNTDLGWFSNIVPCGLEGFSVTSLTEQTGQRVTVDHAAPVFVQKFSEVFSVPLREIPLGELDLNDEREIKQVCWFEEVWPSFHYGDLAVLWKRQSRVLCPRSQLSRPVHSDYCRREPGVSPSSPCAI